MNLSQTQWMRLSAPIVGRFTWFFYPCAWLAGWVGWRTRPGTRANLVRNMLPLCDGDLVRARKEGQLAFRNAARYWVDICSLPHREIGRFEHDHMHLVNPHHLAVLGQPGPIVGVSAHTGTAEIVVQALTYRARRFTALIEELEPPAFHDYVLSLRSSAGGDFYTAGFRGVRACLDALRRGEVVGMLGDRDIQGTGMCATMFGERVKLPRGPWELARRTGAVVLPVFTSRGWNDQFTVHIEEPFRVDSTADAEADVRAAIDRWAILLERHLRRSPGQWAVLEDFWKAHACVES